jgi:hypothetical protein
VVRVLLTLFTPCRLLKRSVEGVYIHTGNFRLPSELWREILLKATHIPYELEDGPTPCSLSAYQNLSYWVHSKWNKNLPIRRNIVLVSRLWRDIGEEFLYQTAFIASVHVLQSLISALRASRQRVCWVKRVSIRGNISSFALNQQLGEILNERNNICMYQDDTMFFSFPLSPTPTNYHHLRCIVLRSPIDRFWSALPLFINLEVLKLFNISIGHTVNAAFPPVSLPHLHFVEFRFFGSAVAEYNLFNVWIPTWKAPKLKTFIVDADNMEILPGIEAHSATIANLGLTGSPLQPPSSLNSPSPMRFQTTSLRRVIAFHYFGTSSWRHLDGCIPLHSVREIELRLEESLGAAVVMANEYGWGSSLQDLRDLFTLTCDGARTPSLSQVIVSIRHEHMKIIDKTVQGMFDGWIEKMEKMRPDVRLKLSFGFDDNGNEWSYDVHSVYRSSKLGSPGLTTSSISFCKLS